MTFARVMHSACRLALMVLCFAAVAMAQTETATISGLITDDTGAVVPGAEVKLQSVDRGSCYQCDYQQCRDLCLRERSSWTVSAHGAQTRL